MTLPCSGDLEPGWLFRIRKWLGSTKPVGGISSVLEHGGSGAERILSSCSFEGRHWLRALSTKSGIWSSHMRPEIWIVWKSSKSAQTGSYMVPFRPHRLWTGNDLLLNYNDYTWNRLMDLPTDERTDGLTCWLTDWLMEWRTNSFTDWLTNKNRKIDWLKLLVSKETVRLGRKKRKHVYQLTVARWTYGLKKTHWLTDRLKDRHTKGLTDRWLYGTMDELTDQLTDWLIDWLHMYGKQRFHSFICLLTKLTLAQRPFWRREWLSREGKK